MLDAGARVHFGAVELALLFNFYCQLSLFDLGYSCDILHKRLLVNNINLRTQFRKANLFAFLILLALIVRLLLRDSGLVPTPEGT